MITGPLKVTPFYYSFSNFCVFSEWEILINNTINFDYSLPSSTVSYNSNTPSFYQTLMHELGHILCLAHLSKQTDLMAPYNNANNQITNGSFTTSCRNDIAEANIITGLSKSIPKTTVPHYVTTDPNNNPNNLQFILSTPITSGCIIPLPPTIQAIPLSPWEIEVKWAYTTSDVDAFDLHHELKVYRSTTPDFNSNTTTDISNSGNEYIDGSIFPLKYNTTYYYRISASNDYGSTNWVTISVNTLPESIPPTPIFSNPSYTFSDPTYWKNQDTYQNYSVINWQPTAQTIGYAILRSDSYNGTYTTVTQISGSTQNKWLDPTADITKTYFYKIESYNDVYTSVLSNPLVVFNMTESCNNTSTLNLTKYDPNNPNQYATDVVNVVYTYDDATHIAIVEAGTIIHLKPGTRGVGFSAKNGQYFHAGITPCEAHISLKSNLVDTVTISNGNAISNKELLLKSTIDSLNIPILTSEINIYPNPTKGLITIVVQDGGFRIELYNSVGIVITQQNHCQNQTTIDISNYATGSYFLKVVTNTNKEEVLNIFKE
jgi:hypothetical protein